MKAIPFYTLPYLLALLPCSLVAQVSVGTMRVVGVRPAVAEAQPASPENTHTVISGETLYSIAKKHHTDIETLQRLNYITSSGIKAGQTLILRDAASSAVATRGGDTERVAAQKPTTNTRSLEPAANTFFFVAQNDTTPATPTTLTTPPTTPPATPREFVYHQVAEGETYTSLAASYNVPQDSLMAWNTELPILQVDNIIRLIKPSADTAEAEESPESQSFVSSYSYHEVGEDETYESIADRFGVPKDSLLAWNPNVLAVEEDDVIRVGRQLVAQSEGDTTAVAVLSDGLTRGGSDKTPKMDEPVNEPILESKISTQGVSFASLGKALKASTENPSSDATGASSFTAPVFAPQGMSLQTLSDGLSRVGDDDEEDEDEEELTTVITPAATVVIPPAPVTPPATVVTPPAPVAPATADADEDEEDDEEGNSEYGAYSTLPASNNGQRFFIAHKTLPIGTVVQIVLPNDGGQLRTTVTSQWQGANTNFALSPACVAFLKLSGKDISMVQLNYTRP